MGVLEGDSSAPRLFRVILGPLFEEKKREKN